MGTRWWRANEKSALPALLTLPALALIVAFVLLGRTREIPAKPNVDSDAVAAGPEDSLSTTIAAAAAPALEGEEEASTATATVVAPSTSSSAQVKGVEPEEDMPVVVPATVSRLSASFVHRDINHVLATGQSLSVGAVGYPAISIKPPYANLMFRTGVVAGDTGLTAFAPLVEGVNPNDETMSSGFANLVTKMAREELLLEQPQGKRSHDLLISAHGIGGTSYSGLKKGTPAYAAGMAQARAALDIAKSRNLSYVVRAVTNVHGESDHSENNVRYAHDLAEWQADYERDVKALTGQKESIPMIHSQISSWSRYGQATSVIPQQQLAITVSSKGKLVLVGPKYNLSYTGDGIHLTNDGYRQMGEYYAKVYRRVILEGKPWEPLRPMSVSREGAVITIKFVVPVPPIVLDEKLVSNPGNAYGFEFSDASPSPPTIAKVTIAGPDTVTITLSTPPTGARKRIRYAFTAIPNAPAGARSGPRGNLRDSDATESRYRYPLHNWCVHFDEAVP